MEFKTADRKNIRMKMAVAGKAGAGKTMGALLIAKGLLSDTATIGLIQTEFGRAECYKDKIGEFKVLDMTPPFSPSKFVEAIELAEQSGIKCLIIDSISDEWAGIGGILDIHQDQTEIVKNSFTAWKRVTPKHDAVFNKILSSPMHIICTMKKKIEYIMEANAQGKQQPKKVGTKDIQRDDVEYKWILQLDIDQEGNLAHATKDNTGLFQGKPAFKITEDTGRTIRNWCLNIKGE